VTDYKNYKKLSIEPDLTQPAVKPVLVSQVEVRQLAAEFNQVLDEHRKAIISLMETTSKLDLVLAYIMQKQNLSIEDLQEWIKAKAEEAKANAVCDSTEQTEQAKA